MEAAVYGLIGTAVGAIITVLTGLLNNRHQLIMRRLELAEQARQARWEAERTDRAERLTRYAGFLSSYWQAERLTCEIMDLIEHQPVGWLEDVNKIIASDPYTTAITSLNDGAAWVSIMSADVRVESAARGASHTFDSLQDLLRGAFQLALKDRPFDLKPSRAKLEESQRDIRALSELLRGELHGGEERPHVLVAAPAG